MDTYGLWDVRPLCSSLLFRYFKGPVLVMAHVVLNALYVPPPPQLSTDVQRAGIDRHCHCTIQSGRFSLERPTLDMALFLPGSSRNHCRNSLDLAGAVEGQILRRYVV